jgi:flagellar biosynthesis protein
MTQALPPPRRKVTLKLASSARNTAPSKLDADQLDILLARAHAHGLAPNVDPQVAAVLGAVRMRDDMPNELYVVLAAVLGSIHAAVTSP